MDTGLIVDLETTGLDSSKHKIIEIGLLEFSVSEGKEANITGMYSALEDPGEPLTPEIQKLTSIDDELLKGQRIDWNYVRQVFERSTVAIAHHAAFEAGFLRARPELKDMSIHWACSVLHIDWQTLGYKSKHLTYLAADHSFLNPFPHRALFDCATTFRLVKPHLKEMIDRSYERSYYIYAVNSAFETKDKLKARDYRWDNERRCWYRVVFESDLGGEREFLGQEIYRGPSRHEEIEILSF